MAANNRRRKNQAKRKTTAAKKVKSAKKSVRAALAGKRTVAKKKSQKKTPSKSTARKTPVLGKKRADAKSGGAVKKQASRRRQSFDSDASARRELGSEAAGQSGDLQGLSNVEAADSESVDELLEEGNAFEADVVAGVQSADDHEGQEVHTHEVPEDDVPGEYLDED
jgi:hypothetical protein